MRKLITSKISDLIASGQELGMEFNTKYELDKLKPGYCLAVYYVNNREDDQWVGQALLPAVLSELTDEQLLDLYILMINKDQGDD